MKNTFESENEALMPEHTEQINNYKLFRNGNAHVPARFWEYKLINVTRGYEKDLLNTNGYLEMNINEAIKKHNGISFSLLVN